MSSIHYKAPIVMIRFDDNRYLAESLLWPEYGSLNETPEKAVEKLTYLLQNSLPRENLFQTGLNVQAADPTIETITLSLERHPTNLGLKGALELTIPVVRYRKEQASGGVYWIGRVPWMDLEFSARREEEWRETAETEIRRCLLRRRGARSLTKLFKCVGVEELTLQTIDLEVTFPTSLEHDKGDGPKEDGGVLKAVTHRFLGKKPAAVFERDAEMKRLAAALMRENRRGVLLVGPSGVGKTAIIRETINQRRHLGMGETPFYETNGARLIAGQTGFGAWQERCDKLVKEALDEKAVLYLGSLYELSHVGQSENMSQGMASYFRPHINRGRLGVICECTPEQYALIEKKDPVLLQAFDRIDIAEPDANKLRRILAAAADPLTRRRGITIEAAAADRLVSLFRRFAGYSAQPRPALQLLQHLCLEHRRGETLTDKAVLASFSRSSGLPLFILDRTQPMSLAETTAFFETAIIGQRTAIRHVVDMLAAIKAQLTKPQQPIASFLFIGPTGVGKTETAKAIATWLFGDANRLTRFDMSEFSDAHGVQRLLAGDSKEPGLLIAAVREQPFSLLVFDEFEKAHPKFFDLLLQILGEARLTDDSGRQARFDNTVVIMTSNLGAERFDRGTVALAETTGDDQHAARHFSREVRNFLRPEIYNRIDAVVPFHALSQEDIRAVTRLELEKLRRRAGLQEANLTLSLDPEVAEFLAKRGYDPKLGARPLKRAVDQRLALPLATQLAKGNQDGIKGYHATLQNEAVVLQTVFPTKQTSGTGDHRGPISADTLQAVASFRSEVYRFNQSDHLEELRSEQVRLGQQITHFAKRRAIAKAKGKASYHFNEQAVLERHRRISNDFAALEKVSNDVYAFENQVHLAWHGYSENTEIDLTQQETLENRFHRMMTRFWWYQVANPDQIIIGIYGKDREKIELLTRRYLNLAHELDMKTEVELFFNKIEADQAQPKKKGEGRRLSEADQAKAAAKRKKKGGPPPPRRTLLAERGIFLSSPESRFPIVNLNMLEDHFKRNPRQILGLALGITGPMARLWFSAETGAHYWMFTQETIQVHTEQDDWAHFLPPSDVERDEKDPGVSRRRAYYSDRIQTIDHNLSDKVVMVNEYPSWETLMHASLYRSMVWEARRHFTP
ncbi:AAA family ATPase [Acanthopleuribacter pedis]|uniref:ATP-dependent Clp protease ATP-binding subunit n=1 Tax=Acanthopleuribacter pedis TaxID=442870 RepID=A0A8J7Q198_9BACT|nr:AAA family ATPase [Acanthopleuribacter pedis]MBO1317270.1 ATP-dependent Clp protease ATP-binding subunit [Acanthopleuribacter pedis]MBO1318577.1 ATP-dependent Clp protease ATP-binding subunit [Acanthopleuribacter pedis]